MRGERNPWATREGTVEDRNHDDLHPSCPSNLKLSRLCASFLQLLNKGCQRREEAINTQTMHTRLASVKNMNRMLPPMISSFTFWSSFRTSSRISCRQYNGYSYVSEVTTTSPIIVPVLQLCVAVKMQTKVCGSTPPLF